MNHRCISTILLAATLSLSVLSATAIAQENPGEETDEVSDVEQTVDRAHSEATRAADSTADESEDGAESRSRRLTVVAGGNVDGNFARPDCRSDSNHRAMYWANHAAYFQALNELSTEGSLPAPMALNTGNSLFPGALGRYLSSRDDGGGVRLAEITAQIPLEVHGLGQREFAIPRTALVDVLEQLQNFEISAQAANLSCESFGGAEAICQYAETAEDDRPFQIVERGGLQIAITTVLEPDLLDDLAPGQREGLDIQDPVDALPRLVDSMREEADLVFVQHQIDSDPAVSRSYRVANQLEGVDLVIASELVESPPSATDTDDASPPESSRMELVEAAATGTPVVSSNTGDRTAANIEINAVRGPGEDSEWNVGDVVPRRVSLDDYDPHPPTRELLASTVERFCEDWGDPVGENAALDEPFELDDLQQFVLDVMRFSTQTEVAILNQKAFRNQSQFPITGHLAKADIYTALPFGNRLVTARVEGSTLESLADQLGDDLVAAGISTDGGDTAINGRPVDPERVYRMATNEFLSIGGDGVFEPEQLGGVETVHPSWSDAPPTIGEITVEYVDSGRHLRRGSVDDGIATEGNFPDLHRHFLWTFTGSLNASYNQVAVENPVVAEEPGYERSELTVQSTDEVNVEGRLVADADSRNHGWNNSFEVQFATTQIQDGDEVEFEETRDRARLRTRYRYKRLRADLGGNWYVPDPFAEGQAESEFTRPESRAWHRLHLRSIAGASFQLFEPLDVRLGFNVSQDVNDPDARPTWGINAGYTLARIRPVEIAGRAVRLESDVEYFYNDIGNENIHEFRSSNRVLFAIFEELFFTTTFNAFAFQNDTVGDPGTNTELTIGVNYQWQRSLQNF